MMKGVAALACLSAVLLATAPQRGVAEGLTAVRPLPGYKCMVLDITDAQAQDPKLDIPILARPNPRALELNAAAGLVVVRTPENRVNGYLEALTFGGVPGWIAASAVRPYASRGQPGARCVPSLMSNGRVGFSS